MIPFFNKYLTNTLAVLLLAAIVAGGFYKLKADALQRSVTSIKEELKTANDRVAARDKTISAQERIIHDERERVAEAEEFKASTQNARRQGQDGPLSPGSRAALERMRRQQADFMSRYH